MKITQAILSRLYYSETDRVRLDGRIISLILQEYYIKVLTFHDRLCKTTLNLKSFWFIKNVAQSWTNLVDFIRRLF